MLFELVLQKSRSIVKLLIYAWLNVALRSPH